MNQAQGGERAIGQHHAGHQHPGPRAQHAAVAPVITIDGPTASGKGTIASRVADALGWHSLDSGALYRLVALLVERELGRTHPSVDEDDPGSVAVLARGMRPVFRGESILLDGEDVSMAIRQEHIGALASRVAAYPPVRAALLELQRDFRKPPGLVADGRDMGTVVFPDAELKVFLTADVGSRAQRRHKQLIEKGFSANLSTLLQVLKDRDARDTGRAVAPLVPAQGAIIIDSTALDIDQTVQQVLKAWKSR